MTRTTAVRQAAEWTLRSGRAYGNPFVDVAVTGVFESPSGRRYELPGFHDGDGTWRVRFSPSEAGTWRYELTSHPADPELRERGTFEAVGEPVRPFLQATPGRGWGFSLESGEPVLVFGDTVYHLFGMAHCGLDVTPFLRRRRDQGVNLLRVRVPVSPFHPPDGHSDWQTRRTWAWGGSEQAPLFDRFNLDWFRTVDEVVRQAEELGLGLELIMEAWGFEFPFNDRQRFTAEYEELWLRHLVARYDAFSSVWFWTPQNEYEYYPDGNPHHDIPRADRWALRISRWLKATAQHGHVVAAHNCPPLPPFAQRFAADPDAVDAIMFQTWGSRDQERGWLADGIEDTIRQSLAGWTGAAVLAEWGYERNPDLELKLPSHRWCDVDHTRRGAWRGTFSGLGVIHGWENTWGPWAILDTDQPGMAHLDHLRRFLLQEVPWATLRPAPDLVAGNADRPEGHRPLALADPAGGVVAAYLPTGGPVTVKLPEGTWSEAWFDPRTGHTVTPGTSHTDGVAACTPPAADDPRADWTVVLRRAAD